MFIFQLCCSSRTHVVLLCCYSDLCNFSTTQKMNIVVYYLFDIYSVHVGPEKKSLCKYWISGSPPEKCFIWKGNSHTSVSTKQIATGASLLCHMHLCNAALTNICTQKKWRESSFTLCCPLLWHCELWYWLWQVYQSLVWWRFGFYIVKEERARFFIM